MSRTYAHRHRPVIVWPAMVDPALRRRIETRLVTMRDEIRGIGNLGVGAEIDTMRKPDEDAAPHEEMSQVIASNRNRAHAEELREIEAALERLAEDPEAFGVCESCEEEIPARRLELRPWVRLCIDCQEADEREHTPGARKHITDYR
ncbi:MAG TPA: TraR/DksA family transcriptional regulator [Nannocystaceae bacterium]|nr:TraR/DksA family transcriptional regulator [Nannocystaceae bacterium]